MKSCALFSSKLATIFNMNKELKLSNSQTRPSALHLSLTVQVHPGQVHLREAIPRTPQKSHQVPHSECQTAALGDV